MCVCVLKLYIFLLPATYTATAMPPLFQLAWTQTHMFTHKYLTSMPNFSLLGEKTVATKELGIFVDQLTDRQNTERSIELLITANYLLSTKYDINTEKAEGLYMTLKQIKFCEHITENKWNVFTFLS